LLTLIKGVLKIKFLSAKLIESDRPILNVFENVISGSYCLLASAWPTLKFSKIKKNYKLI